MTQELTLRMRQDQSQFMDDMVRDLERRYSNQADDESSVVDLDALVTVNSKSTRRVSTRTVAKRTTVCQYQYKDVPRSVAVNEKLLFDFGKQADYLGSALSLLKTCSDMRHVNALKNKIRSKTLATLKLDEMPRNNQNLRPLFLFYSEDDFSATFIYDFSQISPWTNICERVFGDEVMELSYELYQIVAYDPPQPDHSLSTSISTRPTSTPLSNRSNMITARKSSVGSTSSASSASTLDQSLPETSLIRQYYPPYRVYRPNIDSILFNDQAQLRSLKEIIRVIRKKDGESNEVTKKLRSRIDLLLGMNKCWPSSSQTHPFIHYHESGELSPAFVFDVGTFSPWPVILKKFFTAEFLRINREIYSSVLAPPADWLAKWDKGMKSIQSSFNSRKALPSSAPKSKRRCIG
ncbi:uncharacterized protein LOC141853207 [Brevipalpus obovatus]|uniref:uncharacterized protein LOC141853207 n=1 Tax=Brevipalpus obovatus TaxID=246614 RepID=UPI003D9F5BCD